MMQINVCLLLVITAYFCSPSSAAANFHIPVIKSPQIIYDTSPKLRLKGFPYLSKLQLMITGPSRYNQYYLSCPTYDDASYVTNPGCKNPDIPCDYSDIRCITEISKVANKEDGLTLELIGNHK